MYRNTSHIRHRPYKWIAPFSKSKNAFITRHPTAIMHLQVLLICHIPIVMSLNLLWVSEDSFWIMCYASFIFQTSQKPSVKNQGFELKNSSKYKPCLYVPLYKEPSPVRGLPYKWGIMVIIESRAVYPAERQIQLQIIELSPHFVWAHNYQILKLLILLKPVALIDHMNKCVSRCTTKLDGVTLDR